MSVRSGRQHFGLDANQLPVVTDCSALITCFSGFSLIWKATRFWASSLTVTKPSLRAALAWVDRLVRPKPPLWGWKQASARFLHPRALYSVPSNAHTHIITPERDDTDHGRSGRACTHLPTGHISLRKPWALLGALDVRGLPLPDHLRTRVMACNDPTDLQRWLLRALTASSARDAVEG